MRVVERSEDFAAALAPFLTFDEDPYVIVGDDGRLSWMMDGFTTSESYPYARHFRLGCDRVNYMRNSVKAIIDAYDGTTTFYVFDSEDPIIAAYRGVFPSLFHPISELPADLVVYQEDPRDDPAVLARPLRKARAPPL